MSILWAGTFFERSIRYLYHDMTILCRALEVFMVGEFELYCIVVEQHRIHRIYISLLCQSLLRDLDLKWPEFDYWSASNKTFRKPSISGNPWADSVTSCSHFFTTKWLSLYLFRVSGYKEMSSDWWQCCFMAYIEMIKEQPLITANVCCV